MGTFVQKMNNAIQMVDAKLQIVCAMMGTLDLDVNILSTLPPKLEHINPMF